MDHLQRTSAYFDGELPPAEADAAAAHLATCAACQQLLQVAAGIDAALPAPVAAAPVRRSRAPWLAAGAAIAAAAVAIVVLHPWRGTPAPPPEATIALAPSRAVEARFTAPAFAAHRPYHPDRAAGPAHEAIPLAYLAQLEAQGEQAALVAALASSGELARAKDAAAALPASPEAESDRAAVALAAHDPDAALAHAYQALDGNAALAAAHWNLALAARDLGLRHLAIAQLAAVTDPGWIDEARAARAALAAEVAPMGSEYAAFRARGRAMLDGGAPLTAADAARYPANTRIDFFDAVRLASTKERLDALRPLAATLDAALGKPTATAAIDRVTPAMLAAHGKHGPAYRKLLAGAPADVLPELRAGGTSTLDLYIGALIFTGQLSAHLDVAPAITAWHDPWFDVALVRARVAAGLANADLAVEAPLATALAGCTADALALRCAQLASDLAALHAATGFDKRAEQYAAQALAGFRRAGVPGSVHVALAQVADQHKLLGQAALARAELEDIALGATADSVDDCDAARDASIDLADLAVIDGAWDRARAALPAVEPPPPCTNVTAPLSVTLAVDIARHTHDSGDLTAAKKWLAAYAPAADADPTGAARAVVAIGWLRLDPHSDAKDVHAFLAATASTDPDPVVAGVRGWAIATLVDDAAAKQNWPEVIAEARSELDPKRPAAPCTLAASIDDGRLVIAAQPPTGDAIGETRIVAPAELATAKLVSPTISDALRTCDSIEVIARPPFHGRADLLPPELRWYFAGERAPHAAAHAAPRVVEVIDAHPPADLGLAALPSMRGRTGFDVSLAGDSATPTATLAALATATYAELHVHGMVAAEQDAAAFLALSPDARGEFALRADAVRAAHFASAPVIVLAACRASTAVAALAPRWSLPGAFLAAGAGAVVAVDQPIDDAAARPIFDELRRLVLGGMPIERAVAETRSKPGAPAWARRLMVFR
ncbi:MAG TPA: zf-HC2 domain-containing protein [Kofleriaceae bacterium]|jgi:hypothetical protein